MPYLGYNWEDTDTESKKAYTYDFTKLIAPGDTIASVTWELTVQPNSTYVGVDPTPSTRLTAPSHTDFTATVWLDGLQENARYRLAAFFTTTLGAKDDLYAYIRVNPKP